MQMGFAFAVTDELSWMRDQLRSRFGRPGPIARRTPVGQLVKSLISSRTRDAVSLAAYRRLIETYPQRAELAQAPLGDVEAVISEVTFPDVKARYLADTLHQLAMTTPAFDLSFLADWDVGRALAWLERLPGVGRKVSVATLNFSTLERPAFAIDTHILRVLRRFGLVRSKADPRSAYDTIMAMAADWSAVDLLELHIFMKRLGQTVCVLDQPDCPGCPLMRKCKAAPARLLR